MPPIENGTIRFNEDLLPDEDKYNLDTRDRFLLSCIDKVRSSLPDLGLGRAAPMGCTVEYTASSEEVMEALREFLAEHNLGTVGEADGLEFGPAIKSK